MLVYWAPFSFLIVPTQRFGAPSRGLLWGAKLGGVNRMAGALCWVLTQFTNKLQDSGSIREWKSLGWMFYKSPTFCPLYGIFGVSESSVFSVLGTLLRRGPIEAALVCWGRDWSFPSFGYSSAVRNQAPKQALRAKIVHRNAFGERHLPLMNVWSSWFIGSVGAYSHLKMDCPRFGLCEIWRANKMHLQSALTLWTLHSQTPAWWQLAFAGSLEN